MEGAGEGSMLLQGNHLEAGPGSPELGKSPSVSTIGNSFTEQVSSKCLHSPRHCRKDGDLEGQGCHAHRSLVLLPGK